LKEDHYYDDLNDLKKDCKESWEKYAIEEENEWKCVQYFYDVEKNLGYCYAWTGAGFVDSQDMNATVRADITADVDLFKQIGYDAVDLSVSTNVFDYPTVRQQ